MASQPGMPIMRSGAAGPNATAAGGGADAGLKVLPAASPPAPPLRALVDDFLARFGGANGALSTAESQAKRALCDVRVSGGKASETRRTATVQATVRAGRPAANAHAHAP